MLQIKDTLISLDIVEKFFCCDVSACKGVCCVEGDSGAPLEDDEVEVLKKIYPKIKSYLRPESIEAIDAQGTHVIDIEKDQVTTLVNGKECAYAVFENGIAACAIEKAYNDGIVKFRKPVSCHLYPIRIKRYSDFSAINYDRWKICKPARVHGYEQKLHIFEFCMDALKRKFGNDWTRHLKIVAKNYLESEEPEDVD